MNNDTTSRKTRSCLPEICRLEIFLTNSKLFPTLLSAKDKLDKIVLCKKVAKDREQNNDSEIVTESKSLGQNRIRRIKKQICDPWNIVMMFPSF